MDRPKRRFESPVGLLLLSATLAACGEVATSPPRPNVVLIVVDTLRSDRLPFYGAPRDTAPFLSQLAEESRVFENAYSPSSWTLPALVSVLTSVHPFQHGVVSLAGLEREAGEEPIPVNCIPAEIETLAEVLRASGYRTFGVVSNLLVTEDVGFDRGFDRFVQLDDEPADRVNGQVSLWRDEILASEPFFLYLHYIDPHDTYHAREPWLVPYENLTDAGWPEAPLGRSESDLDQIDWILTRIDPKPHQYVGRRARELSSEELDDLFAWMKSAYDSEIGFVDDQVREIFERFDLEQSVVVFLSDHGEEFYEHGALTHGFNLHAETVRVPLLLRLPGGEDPGRVTSPVSTLDVVPTIRKLLGLVEARQDEGIDLFAAFEGRAVHGMLDSKAGFDVEKDMRSISVAGHRLLVHGDGGVELYDTLVDPHERIDIAAQSPEIVADLERRLASVAASAERYSPATCLPSPADRNRLERLRAIGYLGTEADG